MVHYTHLTWASSKPPTPQPFHGTQFNSPIYQTVLRGQLRQERTLLDINLRWRWRRTISISWEYRACLRVVLRFSSFTVCSYSSTVSFYPLTFFLKKNSLIYATRSTTNGNLPNLPWENSLFLPNNRCSTRVRVYTR